MNAETIQTWWKPSEVAKRWRKSENTIRNRCKAGNIVAMKVGKSFLIHETEIARVESQGLPNNEPIRVVKPVKSGVLRGFANRLKKC